MPCLHRLEGVRLSAAPCSRPGRHPGHARYRTFIAMELGCSVEDITALLLGVTATIWCRSPVTPPWPASGHAPDPKDRSTRSWIAPARAAAKSSPCSRPAAPITLRGRHRSNGRGDHQGQETHPAGRGLLRQGVWHRRILRRRASHAGVAWRRKGPGSSAVA